MLLLLPPLLALALAVLCGGSPRALAALPIRGGGLFLAALAVQIALYLPPVRASALVVHVGGALYVVSLGLALVGALRNRALGPAVWVATLGVGLNGVAVVANGGYMPVDVAALRATQGEARVRAVADIRRFNNTRLATASTRLAPLSDVIPVRIAGGTGNVYSIGDVLLTAGVAALIYGATQPRPRARAPRGPQDGQVTTGRGPGRASR